MATIQERVRAAVVASRRVVVALDDDPTGVQTVHDTPVLTVWDVETLVEELRRSAVGERRFRPLVFILTNSRSLPAVEAARLNREIVRNLGSAVEQTNAGGPEEARLGGGVAS